MPVIDTDLVLLPGLFDNELCMSIEEEYNICICAVHVRLPIDKNYSFSSVFFLFYIFSFYEFCDRVILETAIETCIIGVF